MEERGRGVGGASRGGREGAGEGEADVGEMGVVQALPGAMCVCVAARGEGDGEWIEQMDC